MLSVFLLVFSLLQLHASPLGTAFTYQGQLQDSGAIANGTYDFHFSLYDAATSGNQIGPDLTNSAVTVTNGLLLVSLDFGGAAYSSNALWLCIGVRTNGSGGSFTALTPLQPLNPVPFAISGPSGTTVALTNGTSFTTNLTVLGSLTAGSISGNGAGITDISAANLTGTVPVAQGGTGASTSAGAFANLMPSIYDSTSDDPNADGTVALGAGQFLITHDGNLFYASGPGAGRWTSFFNWTGGTSAIGSGSQMSYFASGPMKIYTMGNPIYQTYGSKNTDAQVIQINCNPYDSGSGWVCALVGTNWTPFGYLSTASDGIPVYIQDPVALSFLIPPLQSIPATLPGVGQIVMNGYEQFALTSALVEDGIPGNYSYLQTDPMNAKLHFMAWTGDVFSCYDPNNIDVMTVDYEQATVTIPNLTVKAVNVGGSTWYSGTGSPEGVATAGVGSMYTRTDGGPGTTLYVKESGSGNTGWTAK